MQITFDGKDFEFQWYTNQQLSGSTDSPIAVDTETCAIPPYRPLIEGEDPKTVHPSSLIVPQVAIGLCYDGRQLYLIHPNKLRTFLQRNRNQQWVGHNFSFDFWVMMNHFRSLKDELSEEFLWQMGDNNKFSDTAILDLLLQLGVGKYRYAGNGGIDKKLFMANLGMLSEEWKTGEMDKTDPYRLRFGEWIGLSEQEIEKLPEFMGFCSYALKDVIVTHRIYPLQREKGIGIMKKVGWSPDTKQKTYEIRPDALAKFGCLSEYIQVKGAIALAELSRTPLHIDTKKRDDLEKQARERYADNMRTLIKLEPRLFKRYSLKARNGNAGKIRYNKKTRLPEMSNLVLAERLTSIAQELNISKPPLSDGVKQGISLSTKDWLPIAEAVKDRECDSVKFLNSWCGLGSDVKLMSFFLGLRSEDGKVYSNYNLLMRTGRVSASAHKRGKSLLCPSLNIQQIPREDSKHPERSVRTLFNAGKGYKWGSFDYSYIELVCLAALNRGLFGYSKLGDVIEEHRKSGGLDPHQHTALAVMDLTKEEFLALTIDKQKEYRQKAKSLNFGFPGGLGIDKFIIYSKTNYDVTFTKKEAKEAKKKWIDRYTELKQYLNSPIELILRWQTDLRTAPKLSFVLTKRLSDYLRQTDKERQESNHSDKELESFWEVLSWIAKYKNDPELTQACIERKVNSAVRSLVTYRACTPTGRIRNYTTFTASKNTPFQGLNADSCKLTMWNLMRRGIKVLAYIHDSFEIAVPKGKEKQTSELVTKIMIKTMESVVGQNVPVGVEEQIADCWVK